MVFSSFYFFFKQCVLDFIPDVLVALEHLGNALADFLLDRTCRLTLFSGDGSIIADCFLLEEIEIVGTGAISLKSLDGVSFAWT